MYTGIELTVICVAEIFILASHYAARCAGSGLIFVENEGLTALATIMPPTFVGSEYSSPSVFALRSWGFRLRLRLGASHKCYALTGDVAP